MEANYKEKLTICLLLILTSLAGLAFAGGLQSGLSRTGVLVAGGALVACVFSFALWLNETKNTSLRRVNVRIVSIEQPVYVSRESAIVITSEDNLRKVAKNHGLEILLYDGHDNTSMYYVIGAKYTYIYARKKSSSLEEDVELSVKEIV